MRLSTLLPIVFVSGLVAGHGLIKVPQRRLNGPAMLAACGAAPYKAMNDNKYGPIENAANKIGADYTAACDLYFCRGTTWEDNKNSYQKYTVGQVVNMQTDIEAHHPGFVNVTVLSTATKKAIIPEPLIAWDPWGVPPRSPEEHDFNITIPDLGTQCIEPGKCVLQWFWYSPRGQPEKYPNGNNQTYESCIDFVTV